MKKLPYSSILVLIALVTLFIGSIPLTVKESLSAEDKYFMIGAFNSGNYNYYDSILDLNFNLWHQYTHINKGWNSSVADNYRNDVSVYRSDLSSIININRSKGLYSLMDRPIVQYIAAGQRSDYQCESVQDYDKHSTKYWFYSYNKSIEDKKHGIEDIEDNSAFGKYENGVPAKVKYCKVNNKNSNSDLIIVEGLRANREMSFNYGLDYTNANAYKWFVMPRIRIDGTYAANKNNSNETVCKIIITGWTGNTVKEIPVKVRNFINPNTGKYDGGYLESFYFSSEDTDLSLDKNLNEWFLKPDRSFSQGWDDVCKNDLKIIWTGKCDAWFDRIRIENEPAHQYLTMKQEWLINKVNEETDVSLQSGTGNYFYFEECTFNHFPSLSALNKQITERSGNKSNLIIWLNYGLFKMHIPDCWNYEMTDNELKMYLYDEFELRHIVCGSYAFEGWSKKDFSYDWRHQITFHPATLLAADYEKDKGVLSYPVSPAIYDKWLQYFIDTAEGLTKMIYMYKKMDKLARLPGMTLIGCPQTHLWYSGGHKLKEPSNEEIELQVCLLLGYNSKGIIYFSYDSFADFKDGEYGRGIMDPGYNKLCHRSKNIYGQNKYEKIKQLNKKLKQWGSHLLEFVSEKTKSCVYHNEKERNEFLASTYFNDIITYKHGTLPPGCPQDEPIGEFPKGSVIDCKNERYAQVTTFTKSSSPNDKYFLILNRRCSPFLDYSAEEKAGGKRDFRIKFDVNAKEFESYNNWRIINLETNEVVLTFDKRQDNILVLGWFEPGEGRLYRIEPVK